MINFSHSLSGVFLGLFHRAVEFFLLSSPLPYGAE